MKNLQLSLKRKWFEMTKSGIKTEDYREITPYWCARFLLYKEVKWSIKDYKEMLFPNNITFSESIKSYSKTILSFAKFETNTMTLGYPKSGDTERIIKYEHAGIEIRTGNPEWGAEPDKLYFVVKHGKRIT